MINFGDCVFRYKIESPNTTHKKPTYPAIRKKFQVILSKQGRWSDPRPYLNSFAFPNCLPTDLATLTQVRAYTTVLRWAVHFCPFTILDTEIRNICNILLIFVKKKHT